MLIGCFATCVDLIASVAGFDFYYSLDLIFVVESKCASFLTFELGGAHDVYKNVLSQKALQMLLVPVVVV